jgi:hypothetical protein
MQQNGWIQIKHEKHISWGNGVFVRNILTSHVLPTSSGLEISRPDGQQTLKTVELYALHVRVLEKSCLNYRWNLGRRHNNEMGSF